MDSRTLVTGCVVATIAFAAYTRTLLPGVDLGDTGGFQAAVLWPEISARQAYPLYYALAKPVVATLTPAEPARGLNLFSALCGGAAAGLLAAAVSAVTASAWGGAAAGLLLAFSYTFWSQAVIAEVYTLHLALVGLCMMALLAYERRPARVRLSVCLAVFAAAFGNHLSMILLLPAFALFVWRATPEPRELLRPRVVALAIAIAAAGALQYLPHFMAVWTSIDAPDRWTERAAAFWFDVTKSDWRESMVFGIRGDQLPERLAMAAFDARQQFGIAGLVLAAAGVAALWQRTRRWAVLALLAWAANALFAFTYNVGDPHVFYMPAHYFAAFAAGAAVARAGEAARRRSLPLAVLVAAGALGYAAWRAYDTWPAADRHADRRAKDLVSRLTFGLDERRALLVERLNWQVENALLYETRYHLPRIAWIRLLDVLPHFPMLVDDNHAMGRDVVLTAAAASQVSAAFGPLFRLTPDPAPVATLNGAVDAIAPGAPYVLAVLTPPRDEVLDMAMLEDVLDRLTGGRTLRATGAPYEIVVGRAGEPPLLHRSSTEPFRERVDLPEGSVDIRLEGWVALETFRRNGFGHVTLGRRPVLTIERGVSFVTLGGRPSTTVYAAGLYAVQPRWRIPAGAMRLALLH